jgi:hypothetical protein
MDFDNFEISLGIKKDGKLVNIKKEKKVMVKTLKKHKENTQKLILDNIELEKQIDSIIGAINQDKISKNIKVEQNEKIFGLTVDIDIMNLKNLVDEVNKSDSDEKDYDINEINFINKDENIGIQKLKKALIIELKKYFKKHHLDVLEKIEDVSSNIKPTLCDKKIKKNRKIIIQELRSYLQESLKLKSIAEILPKSNYDTYQLEYDLTLTVNKYISLIEIQKINNIFHDYFLELINNEQIFKKIKMHKFDNSYKSIKIVANYINYDVFLYNDDLEIIDELYSRKKHKLFFLLIEKKIYTINNNFVNLHKSIKCITKCFESFNLRDKEKNSCLVLFDEIDKFKEYYIHYPKTKYSTFKYQYLLNDLYLKKISDLSLEQVEILKYIVKNFGLHFSLIKDVKVINKNEFTLDFISKHQDYHLDNVSLFDYVKKIKENVINEEGARDTYNTFDYFYPHINDIITGVSKEDVLNKIKNLYNLNINHTDIKKNISYIKFKNIDTVEKVNTLLDQFLDNDMLTIFYLTKNRNILSTQKMNFDNRLTIKYIFGLYDKTNKCEICGCKLSIYKEEDNFISIDAINPLLGHTTENDNITLLCGKCNIMKGTNFVGKYSGKPYFYNTLKLKKDKLIELLKYHKQKTLGITYILRKRLDNYIKNIDKI